MALFSSRLPFYESKIRVQNKCHIYAYTYAPTLYDYCMLYEGKEHFVLHIETLLVMVLPALIEILWEIIDHEL